MTNFTFPFSLHSTISRLYIHILPALIQIPPIFYFSAHADSPPFPNPKSKYSIIAQLIVLSLTFSIFPSSRICSSCTSEPNVCALVGIVRTIGVREASLVFGVVVMARGVLLVVKALEALEM